MLECTLANDAVSHVQTSSRDIYPKFTQPVFLEPDPNLTFVIKDVLVWSREPVTFHFRCACWWRIDPATNQLADAAVFVSQLPCCCHSVREAFVRLRTLSTWQWPNRQDSFALLIYRLVLFSQFRRDAFRQNLTVSQSVVNVTNLANVSWMANLTN